MTTKRCSKCKEEKPVGEFGKDRNSKDGLCYVCRECAAKRAREYYAKPEVKERVAKRVMESRISTCLR